MSDIDCVSELVFLNTFGTAVGVCVHACVRSRVRY